MPRLM